MMCVEPLNEPQSLYQPCRCDLLPQSEYENPALRRATGPDRRLHSRCNSKKLSSAGDVRDDPAARRLPGVCLPQNATVGGVEGVELTTEIGGEHYTTGRGSHAGEHRMRRLVLSSHSAILRVE